MARVRLARVVLVAGTIQAVGLAANAALTFLAPSQDEFVRWAIPAGIGLVVAMVQAGVDAARSETSRSGQAPARSGAAGRGGPPGPVPPGRQFPRPGQEGTPPWTGPGWAPPRGGRWTGPGWAPPRGGRGTPLVLALVVVVAVIGAGGAAAAYGAWYGVGWLTGNQAVVADRFDGEVAATSGGVTARVVDVVETRDFTKVVVELTNAGRGTARIPIQAGISLSAPGMNTVEADWQRSRSTWSDALAAGATGQRGTLVFAGRLPPEATTAVLSLAEVVVLGPTEPGSIVLQIPLDPVEVAS